MKKFLLLTAILFGVLVQAQSSFSVTGDPSYPVGVRGQCTDGAGNIYILGQGGPMTQSIYCIKFSSNGTVIWERAIHDSLGWYDGYAIAADSNSVYILGLYHLYQAWQGTSFLMRITPGGQFVWQQNISSLGLVGTDAICTNNGDCVAAGVLTSPSAQTAAAFRIDSTGIIEWSVTLGETGAILTFQSITEGEKGNIYICGETAPGPATLTKINPNGAWLWTHSYNFPAGFIDFNSCAYRSGKVYCCGGVWTNNAAPYYEFLGIMDTSGNCISAKAIYDPIRPFVVEGISFTSNNSILCTGTVSTSGLLQEFDSTFNFIRGRERPNDYLYDGYEIQGRTIAIGLETSGNNTFLFQSLNASWTPNCTNTITNYTVAPFSISQGEYSPVIDSLSFVAGTSTLFTVSTSLVGCNNPINIEESVLQNDFTIYPNPTNGQVALSSTKSVSGELIIINSLGEIIYSATMNSDVTSIDMSANQNGIYFVQLKSENETVTRKIIKQ